MKNPFIVDGCLLPIASLNKLKIYTTISGSIANDSLDAYASDLISSKVIIEKIKGFLSSIQVDITNNPIKDFENCIKSDNKTIHDGANKLAKELSQQIAIVLTTLKNASTKNKEARIDWNESHWEYWASLKHIAIGGGLIQGITGKTILDYLNLILTENSCGNGYYSVSIVENPDTVSVLGAAKISSEFNQSGLAFDFGHSFIKRCLFDKTASGNANFEILPPVAAKYTDWYYSSTEQEIMESEKLDNHIISVISESYMQNLKGCEPDNTIVASIANYINNGKVEKRGGYGKLALLDPQYSSYLSNRLRNILNCDINVILIHDGTAGAIEAFRQYPTTEAFISLGTSIGIGFSPMS